MNLWFQALLIIQSKIQSRAHKTRKIFEMLKIYQFVQTAEAQLIQSHLSLNFVDRIFNSKYAMKEFTMAEAHMVTDWYNLFSNQLFHKMMALKWIEKQ